MFDHEIIVVDIDRLIVLSFRSFLGDVGEVKRMRWGKIFIKFKKELDWSLNNLLDFFMAHPKEIHEEHLVGVIGEALDEEVNERVDKSIAYNVGGGEKIIELEFLYSL